MALIKCGPFPGTVAPGPPPSSAVAQRHASSRAEAVCGEGGAKLRELVDAATQLYQRVASRDGAAEKIEAKRELEAFLAFTLLVDRDRFAAQ